MQHAQQLETFITTYPGKPAFYEVIRLAQELDQAVTMVADNGGLMVFDFADNSTTSVEYK